MAFFYMTDFANGTTSYRKDLSLQGREIGMILLRAQEDLELLQDLQFPPLVGFDADPSITDVFL